MDITSVSELVIAQNLLQQTYIKRGFFSENRLILGPNHIYANQQEILQEIITVGFHAVCGGMLLPIEMEKSDVSFHCLLKLNVK